MARQFEQTSLSQVCHKQHQHYLHQCKEIRHLPWFLLSRLPLDNPKAWSVARWTGWVYLHLLIGKCHFELAQLQNKYGELSPKVAEKLDEDLFVPKKQYWVKTSEEI